MIVILCGFILAFMNELPAYLIIPMFVSTYTFLWGISNVKKGWKEFQEATDKEQLPLRLLGTMALLLVAALMGGLFTVKFIIEVTPWPGTLAFIERLFWYLIVMVVTVGGSAIVGANYDEFVEDAEKQDEQEQDKLELKPLSLNLDSISKIESKIKINNEDHQRKQQ